MDKVLVTGAAGFIGSNFCLALANKGYNVVGVDNFSQGHQLNLAPLAGAKNFSIHTLDIRDEKALSRVAEGCQKIVHLAAFKIPRYSDAVDTLHVNTIGTQSVINVAVANKAKIVFASTSDVYGKNPEVPFHEESNLVMGNPTVKRWAYAISKMYDEQLLFAHHEKYGLDISIIRLFGGYGTNQNLSWWGGPQSVFIGAALKNETMEIHGDGLQTRSFTNVYDHVQGFLLCMEKAEANNNVFNIGATREITILELAKLVWRLTRGEKETAKIKMIPYETFGKYEDVRRRIPDITKARTLLGFNPTITLEEGLISTIQWQKERMRLLEAPAQSLGLPV